MTHKASNFNPIHIFVDTNVLVGGYSGDARFQKDADCLPPFCKLNRKPMLPRGRRKAASGASSCGVP